MQKDARDEIIAYRRQLLVHCYLYYILDTPVITDEQWQWRADRLAYLQGQYGTDAGFYDAAFADWDGSTGYHLARYYDDSIHRAAARLLR